MSYYDLPCDQCGHPNDINWDICHNKDCAETITAPFIIRLASIAAEQTALNDNYRLAKTQLGSKGKGNALMIFEDMIDRQASVTMTAPVDFVFDWFLRKKDAFLPYRKQVELKIREHATYVNAKKRSYVDSAIFADREMIFGAMTLDETGLTSYGPVIMILNTKFVRRNTGLLIENSFNFHDRIVEEHKWTVNDPLPAGNLCVWNERQKLAVIKCKEQIVSNDDSSRFSEYILKSTGDRKTDEFMEAYIDAEFYPAMVEKLKFPADLITDFETNPDLLEYKLQFEELGRKVIVESYAK
ncbi:hypothetical protein ACFFGT_04925 [Mucilaginibacter angelicae]|uniref:Uncharacterized protein n=1 Tax=Mucilaginibacter angelicae TaxID=869718 RepID=A0ABV6L1B4_9SPHI